MDTRIKVYYSMCNRMTSTEPNVAVLYTECIRAVCYLVDDAALDDSLLFSALH